MGIMLLFRWIPPPNWRLVDERVSLLNLNGLYGVTEYIDPNKSYCLERYDAY